MTCDLTKLERGHAAYGLVVEKKGRIQADFYVLQSAEELVLAVPRGLRDALVSTLDHYLIMEDVELEPRELDFWHLAGPLSPTVVDALSAAHAGTVEQLGGPGAIVAVDSAEGETFAARLRDAVAAAGGEVVENETWDALRIERGVPRFGVEVDATLYPQEAALERRAVSFDKGCYLGQEVVYMLENRGHVKRKLVPLDIDGEAPVAVGDVITTPDGATVGEVKSSALGPETGRPVAIAMVKWAAAGPGTELRIGDRVARVRA